MDSGCLDENAVNYKCFFKKDTIVVKLSFLFLYFFEPMSLIIKYNIFFTIAIATPIIAVHFHCNMNYVWVQEGFR